MVADDSVDPKLNLNIDNSGGLSTANGSALSGGPHTTLQENQWYWMRLEMQYGGSNKRVRLYVGEDGGNGAWVFDENHTTSALLARMYLGSRSNVPEDGFELHFDDVKQYDQVSF